MQASHSVVLNFLTTNLAHHFLIDKFFCLYYPKHIQSEAANEQLEQGVALKNITPFWRMIEPNSPLAKKLSFGQGFLKEQRKKEKIDWLFFTIQITLL